MRRLGVLVLDVDLTDAETGAGTSGARNLGLDNGAVLLALFLNVFLDFWVVVSSLLESNTSVRRTLILLVVDQLIGSDHVHEANDTAVLDVVGWLCTGQHGDGIDASIQAGILLHTHSRTRHLEVSLTESDAVQAFDDGVDDFVVGVLAEGNTLVQISKCCLLLG